MRFDLTDLRLFLHVHDAGSISGGARATHMTLASASERIRRMEDRYGAALLVREARGVRPTPAGHTVATHARLVLRQLDRLAGELDAYGKGVKGHVHLLCNTSALSEHLPEALSEFLAGHPGISVELEERPSAQIVDAVRQGLCDLGVVSDAVDTEGLEVRDFCADPLTLVVAAGHPLAQREHAGLADLADVPLVGLAEGSALQALIAQAARRLGQRLHYRVRLRSFEAVCRMVGLGIGAAIVPQAAAMRCAAATAIRMVPLTDAWADRRLRLCARRFDDLPAPARALVAQLEQPAERG